jgi:hypothetical protein
MSRIVKFANFRTPELIVRHVSTFLSAKDVWKA